MKKTMVITALLMASLYAGTVNEDTLFIDYFVEMPEKTALVIGTVMKDSLGVIVVNGTALFSKDVSPDTIHFVRGLPEEQIVQAKIPEKDQEVVFLFGLQQDLRGTHVYFRPQRLKKKELRKGKKILELIVEELGYEK